MLRHCTIEVNNLITMVLEMCIAEHKILFCKMLLTYEYG